MLLNLVRTSDGADWTLAATTALPSRLKFEGQSGVEPATAAAEVALNHQASHSSRHGSQPTANRPPQIEDCTPLVPATETRAYICRLVCQESIDVPHAGWNRIHQSLPPTPREVCMLGFGDSDVYGIFSMFMSYCVAWLCDLRLWPFDLENVSCAAHVRPIYQFLLSYDYRLLSYEYWIFDHISVIWNSHCACAVSRVHIFEIPDLNFAYSLCHFQGAMTKIKPCYRRKTAFSHYEGYKVYCACAVPRDLCIGGPQKPDVTIFWPQIAYTLYSFDGAMMTIKSSLYWSIPMLKRFSVAKKSSQNRSPKWRFFGNLRVLISNIVTETPKGTSLSGTTSFDLFCVKIRLGL